MTIVLSHSNPSNWFLCLICIKVFLLPNGCKSLEPKLHLLSEQWCVFLLLLCCFAYISMVATTVIFRPMNMVLLVLKAWGKFLFGTVTDLHDDLRDYSLPFYHCSAFSEPTPAAWSCMDASWVSFFHLQYEMSACSRPEVYLSTWPTILQISVKKLPRLYASTGGQVWSQAVGDLF